MFNNKRPQWGQTTRTTTDDQDQTTRIRRPGRRRGRKGITRTTSDDQDQTPTQLGSWRPPLSALEEALAANAQKSKWFGPWDGAWDAHSILSWSPVGFFPLGHRPHLATAWAINSYRKYCMIRFDNIYEILISKNLSQNSNIYIYLHRMKIFIV